MKPVLCQFDIRFAHLGVALEGNLGVEDAEAPESFGLRFDCARCFGVLRDCIQTCSLGPRNEEIPTHRPKMVRQPPQQGHPTSIRPLWLDLLGSLSPRVQHGHHRRLPTSTQASPDPIQLPPTRKVLQVLPGRQRRHDKPKRYQALSRNPAPRTLQRADRQQQRLRGTPPRRRCWWRLRWHLSR